MTVSASRFRLCTMCRVEKVLAAFGNNKNGKNGLSGICKACRNSAQKDYVRRNKGKVLSGLNNYYYKNQKALLLQKQQYYKQTKESQVKKSRRYRRKHSEAIWSRWLYRHYGVILAEIPASLVSITIINPE